MALQRAALALLAVLIPATSLAACIGEDESGRKDLPAGPIKPDPTASRQPVVVAYGPSTEQRVLAEIYAEALRRAGYRAGTAGSPDPRGGLQRVEADAYPERARAARSVRGVVSSAQTPYHSGLAVASPRPVARRLRLRTLSDLGRQAREATLSVPRGCDRRRDCLPALERAYGARFRRVIRVRRDVRQEPLRHRRARAGVVHSTDPQLIRNGLNLLADDRRAFPHAGWVLLVRRDALGGGDAPERVAAVADHAVRDLSAEVMQELVARVALDERPASAVARQYLTRSGLVR